MKNIFTCVLYVTIYLTFFGCSSKLSSSATGDQEGPIKTIKGPNTSNNNDIIYADEDILPPSPKKTLDKITQEKIKEIKQSGRHNFKLAIGCPNNLQHRKRFASEIKDWVFLDSFGYAKGNNFLHMDFGNLETLKLITGDGNFSLKGLFKEVIFDSSVARFSHNFDEEHIVLLMNLLDSGGTLYMWADERPFLKDNSNMTNFTPAKWLDILTDKIDELDKLTTAWSGKTIGGPQFSWFFSMFDEPYRAELERQNISNPQIASLLSHYEKKRLVLLKLIFKAIGITLEEKHGRYPLPGEQDFYNNAVYYALSRN